MPCSHIVNLDPNDGLTRPWACVARSPSSVHHRLAVPSFDCSCSNPPLSLNTDQSPLPGTTSLPGSRYKSRQPRRPDQVVAHQIAAEAAYPRPAAYDCCWSSPCISFYAVPGHQLPASVSWPCFDSPDIPGSSGLSSCDDYRNCNYWPQLYPSPIPALLDVQGRQVCSRLLVGNGSNLGGRHPVPDTSGESGRYSYVG